MRAIYSIVTTDTAWQSLLTQCDRAKVPDKRGRSTVDVGALHRSLSFTMRFPSLQDSCVLFYNAAHALVAGTAQKKNDRGIDWNAVWSCTTYRVISEPIQANPSQARLYVVTPEDQEPGTMLFWIGLLFHAFHSIHDLPSGWTSKYG